MCEECTWGYISLIELCVCVLLSYAKLYVSLIHDKVDVHNLEVADWYVLLRVVEVQKLNKISRKFFWRWNEVYIF